MLNGPNVMINQLIESIWKVTHLENSLLYMLVGKNCQSNIHYQSLFVPP
jgi:hypothetical protein